jgi:tetratricopeptide (TPR) repeat protein
MRQARETGDIGAYDRAETALREALALNPDDPDASASLATVLFAKHDFAAALALAQQVYTADPGATQALAIIGDARLELGDYEGARDAYGFLANAASGPAVLSRQSHVADLMGDPDEAIELMEEAEARASRRGRSIEGVAWYRLQLGGLYFNTGRLDQAEPWYAAALDLFPGYSPALAGLGAVEAARGNYDEAIGLYEQAVAAVPQPSLLAALGDLYAHIGDTEAAQRQYETVEFIGQLGELNRTVYNRELALFYADHGIKTGIAVQLALAELDVRKDIYGYDAGAWALYSGGRSGEAQPLMEQALRLGTEDARLLYHAGMIALDLGQRQQARAYLEQALELNPGFSLLQTSEAQQALANLSSSNAFAEARD